MKDFFDNKYIGFFLICIVICIYLFWNLCLHNKLNTTENNDNINIIDSIGQDTIMHTKVMEFTYNGCKYLEFIRDDNSYIVHDNNCKCMSKKLNNITTVINKRVDEKISGLDINNRKNFRVIIDKLNEIENKVNKLSIKTTPKPAAKPVVKKTITKKAKK